MSNESWSDELAKRICREVARLRGQQSMQWLSDRTAEAGKRVSKVSISELENGKRKSVSVADLVILAAALGVPPIELLYPGMPDAKVEGLPGQVDMSWKVAQWFSGEKSKDTLVGMVRRREELRTLIKHNEKALRYTDNPERAVGHTEWIEKYERQLVELDEAIRAAGGVIDE